MVTIESKTKLYFEEFDIICTIIGSRKNLLKGKLVHTIEATKRQNMPKAILFILIFWYLWDSIFFSTLFTRGGLIFAVLVLALVLISYNLIRNRYKMNIKNKEYHYSFTFDNNGVNATNYDEGSKSFSWDNIQGCYIVDDLILMIIDNPKSFLFIRKTDENEKTFINCITELEKQDKLYYLDYIDGIIKLKSVPTSRVKIHKVVGNVITIAVAMGILILDWFGTGYIVYQQISGLIGAIEGSYN